MTGYRWKTLEMVKRWAQKKLFSDEPRRAQDPEAEHKRKCAEGSRAHLLETRACPTDPERVAVRLGLSRRGISLAEAERCLGVSNGLLGKILRAQMPPARTVEWDLWRRLQVMAGTTEEAR